MRAPRSIYESMDDSSVDTFFDHPSSNKRPRTEAANGQLPPKKLRFLETEDYEESLSDWESYSSDGQDTDWRAKMCQLVGLQPHDNDEIIFRGVKRLTKLIEQHQLMKNLPTALPHSTLPKEALPPPNPYYAILHEITCDGHSQGSWRVITSLDHDVPFTSEDGHLVGKNRVKDVEKYALMSDPGLSFIIIKQYRCCRKGARSTTEDDIPAPVVEGETLYLYSEILCDALKAAANSSESKSLYPKIEAKTSVKSPHIWVYRERDQLERSIQSAISPVNAYLRNFLEYFLCHKGKDFKEVDGFLASGIITNRYFEYLFAPGEIVATNPKGDSDLGHVNTFQVLDWPDINSVPAESDSFPANPYKIRITVVFKGLTWYDYDGCLQEKTITLQFTHNAKADMPFDVTTLQIFPIGFTNSNLHERLLDRGKRFWECRERKLLSYSGWDLSKKRHFTTARFMIDVTTFKQEAPSDHPFVAKKLINSFSEEFLRNPVPPEDKLLLMPSTLVGYSMEDKSWFFIWVSSVEDVLWNTESFESLVMEEKTKSLVMALVTNTIQGSGATDFFNSKGKGLVLLLHGGPGTGKTLTAESVADYAKKPLYRVTCGDLGIHPNDVEVRLKRVLNLGKIWNCVVLLDEAEVFLQERSLQDLQRNALVSVFLRILEYYDGILILTSNRVGIFDEGFKSRIQLALHYDDLSQQTRQRVWENFFDRIETFDEDIDIPDLRKNVGKLSRYTLNGREIRNSITTARQLASFNGESLNYSCLKDVIGITTRFDIYLKDRVNEGLDDDELAKEKGIR